MRFVIEQIALYPRDPSRAQRLLNDMGAQGWVQDHATAVGDVFGTPGRNEADLLFNYDLLTQARELEILAYTDGPNWMDLRPNADPHRVSHLGMHCSGVELERWRHFFAHRKISVAQEVHTTRHTNPSIDGERWYHYCIFDTHDILGVDLKFIIKKDHPE